MICISPPDLKLWVTIFVIRIFQPDEAIPKLIQQPELYVELEGVTYLNIVALWHVVWSIRPYNRGRITYSRFGHSMQMRGAFGRCGSTRSLSIRTWYFILQFPIPWFFSSSGEIYCSWALCLSAPMVDPPTKFLICMHEFITWDGHL